MIALERSSPGLSAGFARCRWLAGVAVVAVLGTGCMTSKVDETRQVASSIQANESIVILKKPQLEGVGTEGEFLSCIQEGIGGELVHPQDGQSSKPSANRPLWIWLTLAAMIAFGILRNLHVPGLAMLSP